MIIFVVHADYVVRGQRHGLRGFGDRPLFASVQARVLGHDALSRPLGHVRVRRRSGPHRRGHLARYLRHSRRRRRGWKGKEAEGTLQGFGRLIEFGIDL